MTQPTTISKSIFIDAPRTAVWEFLTDKDKLGEWYHPAEANLSEGNEYVLLTEDEEGKQKKIVWGRVIKMDAPVQLKTTFCIAPFGGEETHLTWSLQDAAGGTRVSLEHEGIAEVTGPAALQLLMALDSGWDNHFADLRNCC